MSATSEHYCVKWNDYHSHIGFFFANLFNSEQLADVTIFAENSSFKCHKVVLSAGSPYFQEILGSVASKHPIIILTGVKADDIAIIIDFIYHGEMKIVDTERFTSVLKTAEMLKINGLTEVTIIQSTDHQLDETSIEDSQEDIVLLNDSYYPAIEETVSAHSIKNEYTSVNDADRHERKKKPKDFKKYSEGNISRALKDMEWGMSLMDACRLHNVPRSTLYSKAKQLAGLHIVTRKEHSNQDCHPALQAIADGMSLKRASEEFNIPKTVLWRRVQKRLDILSKVKCRKKRGGKQQLECEDGIKDEFEEHQENDLCQTRNIPPVEKKSLGKDTMSQESLKKDRLSQAVAACKMGKMSQAVASSTFQVPKTTIWRRLQKCSSPREIKPKIIIEKDDHHYSCTDSYEIPFDKCTELNIDFETSNSMIVLNSDNETHTNSENPIEIKTVKGGETNMTMVLQ